MEERLTYKEVVGRGIAGENGELREAAGVGDIGIEAKTFSFRKSIDGCLFKEVHRKWKREIPMTIDQLKWMGEMLLIRSKEFGNHCYERSSKIFVQGLVTAREGRNSWGVYLTFQFGRGLVLTFPAGYGGKEWGRVSLWISRLMEPPESQPDEGSPERVSKGSENSSQEVSIGCPVSEAQRDDLFWWLDKLLEELKFFRFSVSELCSSENKDVLSERNGSVSRSSIDGGLDPCMDCWRIDDCSDNGNTLSWEELRGYSEEEGVSGCKDYGVSEGFSPECSTGEDEADEAWSSVKGRLKSNSMLAEGQELSDAEVQKQVAVINEQGNVVPEVFELSNSPAQFELISQSVSIQQLDNTGQGMGSLVSVMGQSDGSGSNIQQAGMAVSACLDAMAMLRRGSTSDSCASTAESCVSSPEENIHDCGNAVASLEEIVPITADFWELEESDDEFESPSSSAPERELKQVRERKRWEKSASKLKENLRKKEKSLWIEDIPEGFSRGEHIQIDGEMFDGLAIVKMLIPPSRAKISRIAFHYWSSLVGRPLLRKLREAGIDIDLDLFGKDHLVSAINH